MIENRNVNIITDADGKKLVLINDIRFKAKVRDDWTAVEEYLKEYIGDFYEIEETSEKIYISADFPDEYASSESRIALKGAVAKAKANAAQAVPELIKKAAALLLMLFIFWIQHSQSSDFNCSVTPSFFAICPASLSIISLHSSSISARCFHNVSDRIIYE